MKILLILSMMSFFSCGLNSRLFDNGELLKTNNAATGNDGAGNTGDGSSGTTTTTTTTTTTLPRNANVETQAELQTREENSVWNTDLDLTDDNGNAVTEGFVMLALRNCDTNESYFSGEFEVGASLTVDNPVGTTVGSIDWNNDIQPFFKSPAILADGSSYGFDKKSWAKHIQANYPHLNIYNHFHKNSDGAPINLCTDYRLDNGQGYSDPSTTVFLKSYHLSLDNDALVDDESRQVNGRLAIGGPVFIDPVFNTTSYDRALCSFERLRNEPRSQLTRVASYFQGGSWVGSTVEGSSYWNTIGVFLGSSNYFRHITVDMPQPDPNNGQSCINYIELFSIYEAVTDSSIRRIRLSDGVDNSKFVEVELGIYESF